MFSPQKKRPLLAALLLSAALAWPAAAQFLPLFPDACTSNLTPGQVAITPLPDGNTNVFSTPGALAGKKVVLLVNGNGFGGGSYTALASHLARNGFVAGVLARPGDTANVADLFDSLDAVLAHLGTTTLDPELRIAMVGHSVGGRLVIDAAQIDTEEELGYPIRAVATLAPVASSLASALDGWDTSAFLTIYGSQDEDTDAYDDNANEAFRAYDAAGTESSTTCRTPPCQASSPAFQKTMVFAYGADHAGLVGVGDSGAFLPQDLDYLSPADTLCITKAYLTGFLRWHLWGDSVYKGMLRGEWKPLSVASIDTAEADGFGNPAGSPLRLFLQNSPAQHKTIQAFTGGLGTFTKSADAVLQHAAAGSFTNAPFRVRHHTDYALVGWDADDGDQWVRFAVPAGSRNGSNFTHFSLRLGQLNGAPPPRENPVNGNQNIWLGLEDVNGNESWHQLNGIPAPDRYTDAGPIEAQSHLSTRRIPVSAIDGVNLSDIRGVYLYFNDGTTGTLLVDSLEWHRD